MGAAVEIVNIHNAKTNLSKLIELVAHGEEVIIGRSGKPVAKLVPYQEPAIEKRPRKFGQWKGKVWIADDFNAPDPELEKLFYDSPLFPEDEK